MIERMFGAEYDVIPPGLDKMEPGPMLAMILLAVEVRNSLATTRSSYCAPISAWPLTSKPGYMTT